MKIIQIDKDDWAGGVAKLHEGYRLFGPVKDKNFQNFKALGAGELPDMAFVNSRLSPKSIIYPQSQKMMRYTLDPHDPDHDIMKEISPDEAPKAVLGIRPCDAKAFLLVKRNFDNPDYPDPYWVKAYESTTLVGLACEKPCQTCFCTTAGSGPYDEAGLDVLLVEAGDHYLAKVLTDKGERLVAAAGWTDPADSAAAKARIEEQQAAAESRITSFVQTDQLKDKSTMDLFNAPFWEELAFSCINCGTCTYLCPTCWCFDIQDEVHGKEGIRMRNWDSCMFPLFTLHGSGHNPRNTKVQRVRQRFMHKLKYYVDKYGDGIQCVGCGRCVSQCPVNIDIRRACNQMNSFDPEACVCPA